MSKTFTKEPLHEEDIVVYLKNEKTGSSTTRKCKFIGVVLGFTGTKVKIRQLSKADQFITPDEIEDYGEVSIYPEDVVHILISKYDLNTWVKCKWCMHHKLSEQNLWCQIFDKIMPEDGYCCFGEVEK